MEFQMFFIEIVTLCFKLESRIKRNSDRMNLLSEIFGKFDDCS